MARRGAALDRDLHHESHPGRVRPAARLPGLPGHRLRLRGAGAAHRAPRTGALPLHARLAAARGGRARPPAALPLPSAGVLWTFGALLPVLHLFPIGVLMAERLTYLASAGFCIAAGAVIGSVRRTPARRGGRLRAGGRAGDPLHGPRRRLAERPRALGVGDREGAARRGGEQQPRGGLLLPRGVREGHPAARDRHPRGARLLARPREPGHRRAGARDGPTARAPPTSRPSASRRGRWTRSTSTRGSRRRRGISPAPSATLAAARRLAPEQARLATAQGQHLAKLGRVEEARAAFQAALAIDPADAEARRGAGGAVCAVDGAGFSRDRVPRREPVHHARPRIRSAPPRGCGRRRGPCSCRPSTDRPSLAART